MKISTTYVLQLRTGSKRLPLKMIRPFLGHKTIPEIIIQKLKDTFPKTQIILATSSKEEDTVFRQLADKYEIDFFQGSENDVLKRFTEASEQFGVERIIRICADNPFLDMRQMRYLIESIDRESDYISFDINGLPSIKTHFGFWAEYVTLAALKKVEELTNDSLYREHVTNFIYTHPQFFKLKFLAPNEKVLDMNSVRMTIDTVEDFENAQEIYSQLSNQYGENFGIDEILELLESNKEYQVRMSEQIKLNTK